MGFRYLGQPKTLFRPIGEPRRRTLDQTILSLLSGQSGFWLPLRETAGTLADNANYTAALGAENFTSANAASDPNGNEANATTGWGAVGATVTSQAVEKQTGSYAIKIASAGGTDRGEVDLTLTPGDTYDINVWAKAGQAQSSQVVLNSWVNFHDTPSAVQVPNAWTNYLYHLICTSASTKQRYYSTGTGNNLFVDNLSVRKSGQLDGYYSGPTLAGDTFCGYPAPTFDGVNDFVQLEYNRLESVFDPAVGTVIFAFKMNQTKWEDANSYYLWQIGVDGSNALALLKNAANGLRFSFLEGGSGSSRNVTITSNEYSKWTIAVSRYSSALNASALDILRTNNTGTFSVGTWTATNLASARCQIGATGGGSPLPGSGASPIYINRYLTDGEVAQFFALVRSQEPNAA